MDGQRFDLLVQTCHEALSRRLILRGLAGTGLGLALWQTLEATAAKKKHKHKLKKPKLQRNEFGCVDVGGKCLGNNANCCSGLCEGKKPKKGKKDTSVCVAHDTAGICFADSDICTIGQAVLCNTNPHGPICNCVLTTGNAGFCIGAPAQCRVCSRDTDCHAEFGPRAACIVLGGICSADCPETGRTACAVPCPDEAP